MRRRRARSDKPPRPMVRTSQACSTSRTTAGCRWRTTTRASSCCRQRRDGASGSRRDREERLPQRGLLRRPVLRHPGGSEVNDILPRRSVALGKAAPQIAGALTAPARSLMPMVTAGPVVYPCEGGCASLTAPPYEIEHGVPQLLRVPGPWSATSTTAHRSVPSPGFSRTLTRRRPRLDQRVFHQVAQRAAQLVGPAGEGDDGRRHDLERPGDAPGRGKGPAGGRAARARLDLPRGGP